MNCDICGEEVIETRYNISYREDGIDSWYDTSDKYICSNCIVEWFSQNYTKIKVLYRETKWE